MALGKDFGGMAQGNNKTGQKGTNSIFVMRHAEIKNAYAQKQKFIHAKIVVDIHPQKRGSASDPNHGRGQPHQIQNVVSMQMADLAMSKLLWNIIISTEGAR
jgi:hypothetical protein